MNSLVWRDRYQPDGHEIPMRTWWETQILINTAVQTARALRVGIIAGSIRHDNTTDAAAHLEVGIYAPPGPDVPVLAYALHNGPYITGPRQTRITWNPAVLDEIRPLPDDVVYRYDNDQETSLPMIVHVPVNALLNLIDTFRDSPNTPSLPSNYAWTRYPFDQPAGDQPA